MWTPNPQALVTDLGDELVVLHAESGQMFSLNASGRAAWLALPTTLDGIEAVLTTQGAAPETARSDAQAWLSEMEAEGLVISS